MDERDYVYSYCLVQIIKDNPKGKNGETVLKTDGWILRTKRRELQRVGRGTVG